MKKFLINVSINEVTMLGNWWKDDFKPVQKPNYRNINVKRGKGKIKSY